MDASEKRFQVFVSSTYQDLRQERQEVMQALLELNCIPSGMELFPAGDDDQWTLIKQVIKDCDYYIVIIGGRYGSIGPGGKSFTQLEYEYAVSIGKPVAGFLHEKPGEISAEKTESSEEGRKLLSAFRELVQKKMCKFWISPADLGGKVSRTMAFMMKNYPAEGWVRAGLVPDESTSKEILALKKKIEELQQTLKALQTGPPPDTDGLAQGASQVQLAFKVQGHEKGLPKVKNATVTTTYDEAFSIISPLMIDKASEAQLISALRERFSESLQETLGFDFKISSYGTTIVAADFHALKLQFRALGLITKETSPKSVKDTSTYWTLTPRGDALMTKLNARKAAPLRDLVADTEEV